MTTLEILLIIKTPVSSMTFEIKWGWQRNFSLDSSVLIQFDLLQTCGQVGVRFNLIPSWVGNDNNGIDQDMDHLMLNRFFLELRNGEVLVDKYGKKLNNTEDCTQNWGWNKWDSRIGILWGGQNGEGECDAVDQMHDNEESVASLAFQTHVGIFALEDIP